MGFGDDEVAVEQALDLVRKGLRRVSHEGQRIFLPGVGEAFGMGGSHTATTYFPQDALNPVSSRRGTRLVRRALDGIAGSTVGLYVGIPFCESACTYCPYEFSIGTGGIPDYLDSLNTEIAWYSRALAEREISVSSLFVGGGTPTILSISDLERVLSTVRERFSFTNNAQLCLEGSPNTITEDNGKRKLLLARDYGINRVSMGVQSFSPLVLRFAGRGNDVGEDFTPKALDAIALTTGLFPEVNIDLIQGLRGQDEASIERDIETLAELPTKPSNVTWYNNRARPDVSDFVFMMGSLDEFPLHDQERAIRTRLKIWREMQSLGYRRPFGDKFVLGQADDRFKTLRGSVEESYIGIGADAYSHTPTLFWGNALSSGYQERLGKNLERNRNRLPGHTPREYAQTLNGWMKEVATGRTYGELVQDGITPAVNRLRRYNQMEKLTGRIALGVKRGIDLGELQEQYGWSRVAEFMPRLHALEEHGVLTITDGMVRPTKAGELFENEVAALLYSHPIKMDVFQEYRKGMRRQQQGILKGIAAAGIIGAMLGLGLGELSRLETPLEQLKKENPVAYEQQQAQRELFEMINRP
ncbi:hypothetical protein COV18_07010 [Candidatus Woesearchaeota archaeon CG10_big_fil_rev_8_21_14_0_10_37_12]|nr:MAG: hypothetical protein COV18_07010 [Candidatus Woesearchaeota archaeon CG10_big_fil_rev_8_21_14_0_10_37_12]